MDVIIPRTYGEHGELIIKWEDILFILINVNNYFHLVIFVIKIMMKMRKGTAFSHIVWECLEQLQKCLTEYEFATDRSEEIDKNICATERANSVENTCIKNVDDSTKTLLRKRETKENDINRSDKNRADDISEFGIPDSRQSTFSDGDLYGEGLQDAESLACETGSNDAEYTEETHLKTVYNPICEHGKGFENTQNLRDNVLETERTSGLPAKESYGKSRIVTSAERSELHMLLRNFFESKDNGIIPHELLNRTFGVPILVMEICRAPGIVSDDSEGRLSMGDSCPVLINREDEACINSYVCSLGFRFHCRSENCFYFGVGNRRWGEVNAEINRMEGELRMLCFGRLFGRNVSGSRINNPGDLVISFRIEGFEHSAWRFYYLLFENKKLVLVRQTCNMQRRKMTYIHCLFALLFFLVCLNKASFRKFL